MILWQATFSKLACTAIIACARIKWGHIKIITRMGKNEDILQHLF
jgi:hypothetical protein